MQSFTLGITNLTLTAPDPRWVLPYAVRENGTIISRCWAQKWSEKSALEKAVNVRAHPNLVSLKKSIRQAWNDLGSDYIRDVCSSARKRFQAVVEAKGGHIEKYWTQLTLTELNADQLNEA